MIEVKATISFTEDDKPSLSAINEALLSYNLLARMCGESPIPSEICNLGNGKYELRFDFVYSPLSSDTLADLLTQLSDNPLFGGLL